MHNLWVTCLHPLAPEGHSAGHPQGTDPADPSQCLPPNFYAKDYTPGFTWRAGIRTREIGKLLTPNAHSAGPILHGAQPAFSLVQFPTNKKHPRGRD